jgi:hypothetical protein
MGTLIKFGILVGAAAIIGSEFATTLQVAFPAVGAG